MIQLPSKIRTTLFNTTAEKEPIQLFSHEPDRLFVVIYMSYSNTTYPAFGRSGQDVQNSDALELMFTTGLYLYGPEPIWMGFSPRAGPPTSGFFLVQGVYRA